MAWRHVSTVAASPTMSVKFMRRFELLVRSEIER